MTDVPFRERRETEIRRAVGRVFRKYRDADHNRQPPYAQLRKQLKAELQPIFDKLRRQSVRNFFKVHAPDVSPREMVMPSSEAHTDELIEQMIAHTRQSWKDLGRRKKRADVVEWRKKLLGDQRAMMVAVTETTYNHQAAQDAAWAHLKNTRGTRLQAFWRAEPGRCELCAVVDGKPSAFWRALYPYGPPVHPRCRCTLRFTEMQVVAPAVNV